MKKLISPALMQRCEGEYFRTSGVPSIEVMERAAEALAEAALSILPEARRACVACGPGGNGGDGYACARLLRAAGLDVTVFPSAPAKSPDAVTNASRARELGIPFREADNLPESESSLSDVPDLWIDCLYGTGLSRAPSGVAAALIERMNRDRARGACVIAADIPSGLDGFTGLRYIPCVEADLSVTFQFAKPGHVLNDGLDACGELRVCDVGFPEDAFPAGLPRLIEPGDLRAMFAPRPRNIHKGKCGHLLIVAGSLGMAGAAALCAKAALRSGAGLVTLGCPASIAPLLQTLVPCAMCLPLPDRDGVLCAEAAASLRAALTGKSAVVIGPGLTTRAPAELLELVLESGLPVVIDADALNLLAAHVQLHTLLRPHHVLTPHPGEAARLLGHPCGNPISDAAQLISLGHAVSSTDQRETSAGATSGTEAPASGMPVQGMPAASASGDMLGSADNGDAGATVVLKGASRVIADGNELFISASGTSGMARGGSGDVFAGLLGALLAEPSARTPAQSAAAACELHGLAGEAAAREFGNRGMNAADLIRALPEVFRNLKL